MAAYLRGDADAPVQSDKILERLTLPSAPVAAPVVEKAAPVESVDYSKLDQLSKHREETPAAPGVQAPDKKVELEKANEKLSSLLGGKK